MKKHLIISCLLFLVGCSNDLDTSQLRETQVSEDESMKFYDAPSVEVAIDALPYEVNLPYFIKLVLFQSSTKYGGPIQAARQTIELTKSFNRVLMHGIW